MQRVRRGEGGWFVLGGVGVVGAVLAAVVQPIASAKTGEPPSAPRTNAVVEVPAQLETAPEFDDDEGGGADADDPAIWVDEKRPSASLVLGTLKDGGLSVFTLAGKQIQRITPPAAAGGALAGRFNSVDVLTGFKLAGRKVDLAVVTDRNRDQLRIFSIDPAGASAARGPLTDVTDPGVPFTFAKDLAEANIKANAYGISLFRDDHDRPLALVTREHTTRMGTFELLANGGKVTYRVRRTLDLPASFALPNGTTFTPCEDPGDGPQSEGVFVDEEQDVAFVAQEDVGLWRIDADLRGNPVLIDKTREFGVPATFDPVTEECVVSGPDPGFGGTNLSADVEGTTVFDAGDGEGYLLLSSQGNNTVAVYERDGRNAFVGTFRISAGKGDVDAVEETDGMTVTNVALPGFPQGLLVLQDGSNTPDVPGADGEPRDNSNFKFVSWGAVAQGFHPRLDVNPDGD